MSTVRAMQPAIDIRNLSRSFGELSAVDDLTLSVHQGEMFALVGPDGAGKTTTIRMLCGVLAPTSGSATVLGHNLLEEPDAVKRQIGYLSQKFSLYGDLTVDENIEFFAQINGVYEYRARRDQLLEFTRLAPFRDRLAEQLSGGMRQKLALACTLVHTPRLIFLDEPTTGVDPVSRRDFWSILHSLLARGITIVMSTPYLDEAERCTRVAMMDKGRLMKVDDPVRLKSYMRGEIIEIVCDRVREAARVLRGGLPVREVQIFGDRIHVVVDEAKSVLSPIERLLNAERITIASRRTVPPSLENVYISLLTHPEHQGSAA